MIDPPLPPDEADRLASLQALGLLDTPLEGRFERITELAQVLLDVPIAAISLVDEDRQWFKSVRGLDVDQTERRVAFCAHTIVDRETQIVRDARENERFCQNPLVTGDPGIVFYAGHPLRSADGAYLGSLCVIDREPRDFDEPQQAVLERLAHLAEQEINHAPADACVPEFVSLLEDQLLSSLTDPVTRLWNLPGMTAVLGHLLAERPDTLEPIGVLALTLDEFPALVAKHGDDAHKLLREMAQRISMTLWPKDIASYLGDGRFLMAIRSGEPSYQVGRFADQFKMIFSTQEEFNGLGSIRLTTKTKVFSPTPLTTAQTLIATADAPTKPLQRKSA